MFGYVMPFKSELKVCEWGQYQAWYCGLCKVLKKEYGHIPRLALDYDCTFLAMLLAALGGENGKPCELQRCGYKPFRKPMPVAPQNKALTFAADINVLLYYHKLADDWRDERNVWAWMAKLAMQPAAKRAAQRQPEAAEAIAAGIGLLSQYESQKEREIDVVADAFAGMLQKVVCSFAGLKDAEKQALAWLGYHLGRWIYLADAWEDRAKDEKANLYNPFVLNGMDAERASFLLYASLFEMEKAYNLLTLSCNRGVLDNIIYQGCRQRSKQLLEGKNG